MRIVVWGINYAPEQTGIGPYNTALCEFLAQRGHAVEMVAGFEYYPAWEKKPEDRGRLYRDEIRNGVRLHRCWLYVPRKVRALKRIAHELSFVTSSFLRVLLLQRPDAYVVVSPPLLLGLAAAVAGFLKRSPFVFHVQDLQPDAAVRLGMLQADRWLTRMLYALESIAYAGAARVSTISPGILRMMRTKKVADSKLLLFPNGVRFPETLPPKGNFRQRHGIAADAFIVLYSGNLGQKQGLGALLDAARLLQERSSTGRPIQFVIAGTGAGRDQTEAQIARENLRNILLLPLQPSQEYREMMVDADCCAITQQPGTGALFFPSKLLTTLAFAKPVLSIADPDSDLAEAVLEGNFGANVPPGSPATAAELIEKWAQPAMDLGPVGERGRQFVARFEMQEVLCNFERELLRITSHSQTVTEADVLGSTPAPPAKGEVVP